MTFLRTAWRDGLAVLCAFIALPVWALFLWSVA